MSEPVESQAAQESFEVWKNEWHEKLRKEYLHGDLTLKEYSDDGESGPSAEEAWLAAWMQAHQQGRVEERKECARIAETICQHRRGATSTCEFGRAPELIATAIRTRK